MGPLEARPDPLTVVLMGPAGAGKTTVGRALADELGWPFLDADDFHAPESIARMRDGVSLTDVDRLPWLARVHDAILAVHTAGHSIVVACSALRQRYREQLAAGVGSTHWIYLEAPPALLAQRLAERPQHFAGPTILSGQLADLEPPADALTISARLPVDDIVRRIRSAIRS